MNCGFTTANSHGASLTISRPDAVVILEIFSKKTQTTPSQVIEMCRKRLAAYLRATTGKEQR